LLHQVLLSARLNAGEGYQHLPVAEMLKSFEVLQPNQHKSKATGMVEMPSVL
jgi:hypothetical protein